MKETFYQKKGLAIEQIAAELFLLSKNDKLPIISELQEKYELSRGTVQNALSFLKEVKAIETESRGHLGTYIKEIDYQILQSYVVKNQLTATMPLPYSKLYEGFATGLYLAFKEGDIKLNMVYIRGSEDRIDAVKKGLYDMAVVSRFAAEHEIKINKTIDIALKFGPKSYLSEHVLLLASKEHQSITDGMRVGIDRDSLDHLMLTNEHIKGKEVELVEVPANQLIYALRENQIDAGIWNYDEIVDKNYEDLNVQFIPLKEEHKAMNEAVIICRKENLVIESICKKNIVIRKMLDIQNKIKNGQMTPRY
ncbi:GntR family transcriptional regulator YhfZ [Desemzia incerta]|uniref:GntR family transcriptional regulator YhfZ n=1 Tax=Desemzia incerta TaxID=82801 RepID=UPI0016610165|nr:GntR family transcriptional regulator YhfZ [Desemzia incerta]